ncbi:MAG: hypothetical protein V4565_00355 [Bacteroidota bacterium]
MKKIIFLVASVVLISCKKEPKKSLELDLSGEMMQVNTQTVIQDPSNQSNYYSQVDSLVKYGYGYKIVLPDSLIGKAMKVVLSAKVKETESITGELNISINEPNMSTLFWGFTEAKKSVKVANNWIAIKDSVIIPANQNNKKGSALFIFSSKPTGKGFFCVDNFKIKITQE